MGTFVSAARSLYTNGVGRECKRVILIMVYESKGAGLAEP